MFDQYHGYTNEQFFGGGVQLFDHQRVAGRWFDNAVGPAMDAFSRSQPCSTTSLLREAKHARDNLTDGFRSKWAERLERLVAIAEKMVAHEKAFKAVERAIVQAYALGLDPYELRQVIERATEKGKTLYEESKVETLS